MGRKRYYRQLKTYTALCRRYDGVEMGVKVHGKVFFFFFVSMNTIFVVVVNQPQNLSTKIIPISLLPTPLFPSALC